MRIGKEDGKWRLGKVERKKTEVNEIREIKKEGRKEGRRKRGTVIRRGDKKIGENEGRL